MEARLKSTNLKSESGNVVCNRRRDRSTSAVTADANSTFLTTTYTSPTLLLWPPYVIGQTIVFLPSDFYLLLLSSFLFLA